MADLETGPLESSPDDKNLRDGLEELEELRWERRRFFSKAFFGFVGLVALVALVVFSPTINRRAAGGLRGGQEAIVSRASVVGVDFEAWTEVSDVVILEVRFNGVMVRALDGTNAGKEGWLRSGSLRVN